MKSLFYDFLFVMLTCCVVAVVSLAALLFTLVTFPCQLAIRVNVGLRRFKSFSTYIATLPESVWISVHTAVITAGVLFAALGGLMASGYVTWFGVGICVSATALSIYRVYVITRP